jgi:DNA/RNA endonuclease YhcR with UshA esterase domain
MSHCRSCGRYVGPYEACPHCGAHLTGRVSIRVLKIATIALLALGLPALWFVATHSQVPTIAIDQIGATTNMAYARVEGWVVRGPSFYEESHTLSFTLRDESGGEIQVSAFRREADSLRSAGNVPALGDWVSVAGTLRVREESAALTINVPDHLNVARPEAVEVEIGSITAADRLRRTRVRGQVWAVRKPYSGLTLITLRDATGTIDVAIDSGLEALTGALLPVTPGQSLEIVATVSLYRDTAQLVPASVADIRLLEDSIPVAREAGVGTLAESDAGSMVGVEGTIADVTVFGAGRKLTLDDGSGEITVLLWEDMVNMLPAPGSLVAGARLRAVGTLAVYQGELELIPERPVDVQLLAPGPAESSTGPPTPLGELTSERLGDTLTVEGRVVEAASFSGGFKFTLDDGSGQIVLLTWSRVYRELSAPSSLDVGAQVRATGELEEYEGRLQIVPAAAAGVTVLAPGSLNPPERLIGSLTFEDVGTTILVAGGVTRAEPFSSGFRMWVGDGSGELVVLLWDGIHECVAQADDLVPGARVRLTGVVQEYRGELELIPRLPHDVQLVQQ